MSHLRKKVYVAAGYNTTFFGPGRKEFNPKKPMPTFDGYLMETARGTCEQAHGTDIDEGFIGSFMSGRFLKQGNLPGFLPMMVPSLLKKPCTGVEGACGTGGRAIASAVKAVLSDLSDVVFVSAFEVQNVVKSVYGADILAGAGYYQQDRKDGQAYYFPGVFSDRAGAYYDKYGMDYTRKGFAKWYEQAILNARENSKAQEYHNTVENLYERGLSPPDSKHFLPHLGHTDCSKVSDGAASILVLSEEGLERCGISKEQAIEIVALGEAEGDISQAPEDLTVFDTTAKAASKAFDNGNITKEDLGLLEVHDCFTISGILSLEAIGLAKPGKAPQFVLDGETSPQGKIPTNLSGGLCGFGHPTGASGVRQMVDLWQQFTGQAENQIDLQKPYGMMVSMGGNDKTVTSIIVKSCL